MVSELKTAFDAKKSELMEGAGSGYHILTQAELEQLLERAFLSGAQASQDQCAELVSSAFKTK